MSESPSSEVFNDGVVFLKKRGRKNVTFEEVSYEEALAHNPLSKRSQKNWEKMQQNTKEVKELESEIARRISFLSKEGVEGEDITIDLEGVEDPFRNKRFAAAFGTIHATVDLLDMVDPQNELNYGTIYAGSNYGIVAPEYVEGLSGDPKKLWESATLEQFKENGKYNQISLLDDGRFFLTIIKPGAVESIPLQVDPQFVEPIREYLKKNPLNWDSANEGWKNGYSEIGGVYEFFRVIPLLRTREIWIDLKWRGQHTNPVIEGGPFGINDSAEISVQPVSYTETE